MNMTESLIGRPVRRGTSGSLVRCHTWLLRATTATYVDSVYKLEAIMGSTIREDSSENADGVLRPQFVLYNWNASPRIPPP